MSSTLTIQAFIFDPELTERFIQFAYDLYRDDAQWLPPLRQELARLLSPAASFYHQQGNAHRLFLATLGGQTAGRIAAMVNRALRDAQPRRGCLLRSLCNPSSNRHNPADAPRRMGRMAFARPAPRGDPLAPM